MKGLEKKFHVVKLATPNIRVDAIVLEFENPIARKSIFHWAVEMKRIDPKLTFDVCDKLELEELAYIFTIKDTHHADTRMMFLEQVRAELAEYRQNAQMHGWPL